MVVGGGNATHVKPPVHAPEIVITFCGDKVQGSRFLWKSRAGCLKQPTQQKEGGRGYGRHSNRTAESVEI